MVPLWGPRGRVCIGEVSFQVELLGNLGKTPEQGKSRETLLQGLTARRQASLQVKRHVEIAGPLTLRTTMYRDE